MNILIIGATSGIGKALFKNYVKENHRVGIVGRRTHLLEELRQQHPANTVIATADITKQDETERAINLLLKELGNIDLAIVCSGTGDINSSLDYAVERPTLDTNVTGWTFVVDTFYRLFEQQGHGHLVAITSVGGLRGEPGAPAYSATKAYQINYMEALRKKAFKAGGSITVTDVRPGLVDTAMAKGRNSESHQTRLDGQVVTELGEAKGDGLFWVMPVEKVVRQISAAIHHRKSKVYVTKRWHILAVINKNLPFYLYKRM